MASWSLLPSMSPPKSRIRHILWLFNRRRRLLQKGFASKSVAIFSSTTGGVNWGLELFTRWHSTESLWWRSKDILYSNRRRSTSKKWLWFLQQHWQRLQRRVFIMNLAIKTRYLISPIKNQWKRMELIQLINSEMPPESLSMITLKIMLRNHFFCIFHFSLVSHVCCIAPHVMVK